MRSHPVLHSVTAGQGNSIGPEERGQEKWEPVFRVAPEAPMNNGAHPRPGRATI